MLKIVQKNVHFESQLKNTAYTNPAQPEMFEDFTYLPWESIAEL